jgi:hypothetical protein
MNEITFDPKRPLTLADLRRFVERCGEFGLPDDSEIRARVSFGQKLTRIAVRDSETATEERM